MVLQAVFVVSEMNKESAELNGKQLY